MKISIDLRSLSSGSISGVENYTMNIVENLLRQDKKNNYALFYNAYEARLPSDYHYVNSKMALSRIPNKLLNLAFKFGLTSIEKFISDSDTLTPNPSPKGRGENLLDWFFMPNLNQFNILPNTKLALTVHDLSPVVAPEFYDSKRRLWHWFLNYKKAFERADLIFAVSEYTKQDLLKLFQIQENKIKVVHHGVDSEAFSKKINQEKLRQLRNEKNLPGEFILFLNTIEPRKNLEGLIKAFEVLDSKSFLVIAGKSGWKNKSIFKQIQNSKKRNKIIYLDYISETQKPALIKMASVLVYPSFYEGFGMQILEAFSLGTPVLASQVTALPEVSGDAALLVNPYNTKDIAHALQHLLTDSEFRDRLAQKGLERAKEFSWQKSASQILTAFENFK
jgi:glycosyltransferase involved in cell wall biosynthesis